MPTPAISVIIPTLLKPDPRPGRSGSGSVQYWLSSAVSSVLRQSIFTAAKPTTAELIISFDAASTGQPHPPETHGSITIRYVKAAEPGHAHTVNAAVAASTAPVLAFLDDDDLWDSLWLAAALPHLSTAGFISASTLLVFPDGQTAGLGDYPVPSTWVMRRSTWDHVGSFDPSLRVHCDSDFLGRLNRTAFAFTGHGPAPIKRTHLLDASSWNDMSPTTLEIGKYAELKPTNLPRPLILRNLNPEGMMGSRDADPAWAARSRSDHAEILRRYKTMPA